MSVDPVSLGIKVALTAASIGLQMLNKTEGPRLDTLDVSLADYGTPIRRFWGIRRLEGCPIIWAEKLREDKVESKGKGGKYESYKYYGTWANLIADHEIDAIRRVWMDKHLVYQTKDAGPIAPVLNLGSHDGTLMGKIGLYNKRVYLGTEDQQPDPRMEAWCEDRYGADSCPAYRGVSYIVFQNIPLEKFGNRIPQLTIEAVNQKTDSFPYEAKAAPPGIAHLDGFTLSPDATKFFIGDDDTFEVWDTPTRTKMYGGSVSSGSVTNGVGVFNDGSFCLIANGHDLAIYGPGGGGAALDEDVFAVEQSGITVVRDGSGTQHTATFPFSFLRTFYFNGISINPDTVTGFPWKPSCFKMDSYGDIWAIGCLVGPGVDATALYFYRVVDYSNRAVSGFQVATMPAGGPSLSPVGCHVQGSWLVQWDDVAYSIDDETFSITGSSANLWSYPTSKQFVNHSSGQPTVWLDFSEVDIATASVVRTVDPNDWVTPAPDARVYDPVNHAIIANYSGQIFWLYVDRIGNTGVTLGSIVDDVAGWCGIDVDASALDQTVYGYSVVQGTGKDMIAPLLDMHDSDCRPHDFSIQFVKRGQASQGTITTPNFVRDGKPEQETRYTVSIAQDTDLPRRLSVNFADRDKDQQTNTVISQRPLDSVDGVREQSIDLTTYVTTPAEAQQLSDRRFRRMWNEREEIDNALTMQSLGMEPADVWTLSLDGAERNARLTKMTISQGRIKCTWSRDALTLNGLNSSQGASMDGRDDEVIYVPGPAKGIVLETPYLSDGEVNQAPLIHYAAGTYGENFNFPGVIFYESDADNNEFSQWNGVESASRATWGYVSGALNDCDPWVWDRGSSLSVNTFGRTLTSTTEAAIDADPSVNQAVIGNEIVNFVTATLEIDGTYTVTGFKRGRRGTEWACSTHVGGETFVLASSLQEDGYSLSDVGLSRTFKAEMLGRDPTFSETTEIVLSGATLKPYAPARLKWVFDGTDLLGMITRRTRIGGSWVGGTTIPLSENSEAYEIDIYNGATFKRTITVSGTNTFTYTAAMATADGLTLPTLPTSYVYQMSDAVGRGYALAA